MRIINCEKTSTPTFNEWVERVKECRHGHFIVADGGEAELDINLDLSLDVLDACFCLQRLTKTLEMLEVKNELDQGILFEILQLVITATTPDIVQVERYFALVKEVEDFYDKLCFLNDYNPDSKMEFRPSPDIDLFVLGMAEWISTEKQDDYMEARYEFTSGEIDLPGLITRVQSIRVAK